MQVAERQLQDVLQIERAVAEHQKVGTHACKMIPPDAQTIALFKDRQDLNQAAKDVVNALHAQSWTECVGAEARTNPETGNRYLCIYVVPSVDGPEARNLLDEFVDSSLPASALEVESELIFSVVERRAA